MNGDGLRSMIAGLVAAVWAVVALTTLYTRDYTPLGIVTPVMMAVVGFLYGFKSEVKRLRPPEDKETK